MSSRILSLIACVTISAGLAAQTPTLLPYPKTKAADVVDDYFGTKVPDPYRWLEDDNSAETKAWVEAQNKVTFAYLESIPERSQIQNRLTALWNYERFGSPSRRGPWYFFSRNTGLQRQSVLYKTRSLSAAPEVLLDPNTLSKDGTVALTGAAFTEDGARLAYGLAAAGSDWNEWHVRDVATGQDLPDVIKWVKFSGAAWLKDGSGFFYSTYDAPKTGEALTGINKNQKVYFHKVGTPQDRDELVYARPDRPEWLLNADVTDDGRFLLIVQRESTDPKTRIFIKDLTKPGAQIAPFLDRFDAFYDVVGNDGARFYVHTDNGAPRKRLVAIDVDKPEPAAWKTLIAEGPNRDVLDGLTMVNNRFVATWMTDAHNKVRFYNVDGTPDGEIALPGIGAVGAFTGRREQTEGFYSFTSFTYPTTIFRHDFAAKRSEVFRQPTVDFKPAEYETAQVFYASKDGTKIPMFVTARKGLQRNGQNPTLLFGYGGFDISLTPSFSPANVAWIEMGGVYAVPNLRGGGEYGKAWHDAGRLKNKQNVFDDFIAAAEYLIRERYTSTPKLAIFGGSNGGLLVGAAITQRPDLFGAALPAVGVMDMLRFHKFTIGWAWKSDYGSSETKEGFDTLIKYSPLQNIKSGTAYPATLVTTADHDDRVVPAHSFKFAAALQAAHKGKAPALIRIETSAGHGAGKPTDKIIQEAADRLAFLVANLRMQLAPARSNEARVR
jgi:prolyl oligopeptidase